ncbi:MAG: CotH kinase family protein [Defluviitaleaceae bacterium]|nr:CotH kinase family protein [Defluviitaleaceae bacterium]
MTRKHLLIAAVILLFGAGGIIYFLLFSGSAPRETPRQSPHIDIPIRHIDPPPDPMPVSSELFVSFSREAGFFAESFYLELSAPEGAEIFFTLDGSYPNTNTARYTAPIYVDAPAPGLPIENSPAYWDADVHTLSRVTSFTVRAVAVMGEWASEIATRSFIMGTDVFTRFCGDTLIFALTSDPYGLFDHHEGILVAGIDRENWRNEFYLRYGRWPNYGYEGHNENPASPANFNRRGPESERAVHVEMFGPTGTLHLSQNAGMRVRGGFSRAVEPQKSLELFARREYDDYNQFRFAFFDDEFAHDGSLIDRYRRVRLRNGGSDRDAGFIRDELSQSLFRQAGHSTTQTHRPAAVFLNGEYYGAAWLKSPRTANHLARLYGNDETRSASGLAESERFEVITGGDRRNDAWWSGEDHAVRDFQEIHRMAMAGFTGATGEAQFHDFIRRIDLEEWIRYYAMQIYINNLDWPNHNMELWRYFPTAEEKNDPSVHPHLRDGKWRVFAHDIEAAWAIWDNYDHRAQEDTLRHILTGTGDRWNSSQSSAFLHAFVDYDPTRAMLANAFVDIIEGAFAPANVRRTLDVLIAQIEREHTYALQTDAINPGEPWWPTTYSVADSRDAIRRFAEDRPYAIFASIHTNLGFDPNDRYAVTLTTNAGGGAMMNTRILTEGQTVTGNYFEGTQIKITAQPHAGYAVDYWLINGARHEGTYVTVHYNAEIVLYFCMV